MAGGSGGTGAINNSEQQTGGSGGQGGAVATAGSAGNPGAVYPGTKVAADGGTGGTAGTEGSNGGPGGQGALNDGSSAYNGGGGGGGGGGNGIPSQGIGGNGGDGADGYGGGGGGGGGAGGNGSVVAANGTYTTPSTIPASVTGGNGGAGGAGNDSYGSSGGDGGDGGTAISAPNGGTITIAAASVTGGKGGAAGAAGHGNPTIAGLGGAGISGAGLTVRLNNGSVAGGTGRGSQAASIDFTGGANTLTLNGGTLSGAIALDTAATTLTLDQAKAATLAVAITGTGDVTDAGAGTLTLTAASAYTGSTTIAAGSTLKLGDGTTDGSLANTSAIVDDGTLIVDNAGYTSIGVAISGSGSLVKQGAGTLTLSGANSYSGGTTLTAGTLEATTGTTAPLKGPVQVLAALPGTTSSVGTGTIAFDGGTLRLDGIALDNAVTLDANGGTIYAGSGNGTDIDTLSGTIATAAGTTAPGGLNVKGYGTLVLTGDAAVAGGLTIDGVTVQIGDGNATGTLSGNAAVGYGSTLAFDHAAGTTATYAGDLSGEGNFRQVAGVTVLTGANTLSGQTVIDAGTLRAGASGALSGASQVYFTSSTDATTQQPVSGTLDLGGFDQSVAGLAGNGASSQGGTFVPTGTVTNSGTAPVTLTIAASADGSGSSEGYGDGYRYIPPFAGTIQDGAGTLALDVEGSLSLAAASTFTGGTRITAGGTLELTSGYVSGGTGATPYSSGRVAGAIADGGTLVLSQTTRDGSAVTVDNAISGSGGVLVNGGSSPIVLTGANTYTGDTQVSSGTLRGGATDTFSAASTVELGFASLDLGGYDQAIGGLADLQDGFPFSSVGNSGGSTGTAAATLTVGGNNASTTFSGTVVDGDPANGGSGAALALVKTGTGKLTLSGANSYSGGSTIAGGTLDFQVDAAAGTGDVITFTAGSADELELDASRDSGSLFGKTLFGFGDGDALDLSAFTYTDGATATVADGVLTVTNGDATERFMLQGAAYTNLNVAQDEEGGTIVTAYAAPTITGTAAGQQTANNAAVNPFAGATVADPNSGTDTLIIALSGASGTLSGAGLSIDENGNYRLYGSSAQVTQQLRALTFTPAAGAAGTSTTTTFTLTDASSGSFGLVATDAMTMVTNTVALAPAPTPVQPAPVQTAPTPVQTAPAPVQTAPTPVQTAPAPVAPDAVSLDRMVSYRRGVFTLTGSASSAAGVASVEVSAVLNDGERQSLGFAAVNGDGTFTFADRIGANQQGFIEATLTDGAGVRTTSADAGFSLTGGLNQGGFRARQTAYTDAGDAITSTTLFRAAGDRSVDVQAAGQEFKSDFFDTFNNNGAPSNTFVFDPGHGLDVVNLFRVGGADHDTLSFKGADFGNDIATVLQNAHNARGGVVITDPVSQDTVKLTGITKQQLVQNQNDFAFHA